MTEDEKITTERQLLNAVVLRASIRDTVVRAAARFKNPSVAIVEGLSTTQITITEGAADA